MAKKYDKVVIKTSSNPKKKLDAVFSNSKIWTTTPKQRTKHKDPAIDLAIARI